MTQKKQEKFATPWKAFAARWQKYYTPPGQPSKQAITVYRRFARQAFANLKRQPRVLVLGATPELRDILAGLKVEVSIIDINMEMILAMTELTKKKNFHEIIVKGNWVNMPFASNYYDLVMGDLVLPNIPGSLQTKFLKEVKRVLKPKGYFITKMEVVPDDWQFKSFDSVLNKHAKIPVSRNTACELFCYLLHNVYRPKAHIVDVGRIKKGLQKYWEKGKYKHRSAKITKLLNDIWEMWKPMEKKWTTAYEKEIAKQISPYFKILKKKVLNDCYFHEIDESFPLWFCQVKR